MDSHGSGAGAYYYNYLLLQPLSGTAQKINIMMPQDVDFTVGREIKSYVCSGAYVVLRLEGGLEASQKDKYETG